MKRIALLALWCASFPMGAANAEPAPDRRSVLMIAIDDLRDTVGFLRNFSDIETPHMDRLAARGVTFTNAHCAAPACLPSRSALLTGLSPGTTGLYENGQKWPEALQEHVTLTREFMDQGYRVVGAGKIYHGSGTLEYWHQFTHVPFDSDYGTDGEPWGKPLDLPDARTRDGKRVAACIEALQQASDQPLFLACGIVKPHLPFNAPRKYFEQFPLEKINLPPQLEGDLDDLPPLARRIALGVPGSGSQHRDVLEHGIWKKNIQAYLACVAFADVMVGKLLDAWDASPHSRNGIIVLWGDHGWHLGEKEHWKKFSLWNVATRTPLLIVAPGIARAGARCDAAVNLLDLFPTLLELCDLPERSDLEGQSLVPLLEDPGSGWPHGSVTFHGKDNLSIHQGKWHAIYYRDGTRELYDLEADPNEFSNLAERPDSQAVLDSLWEAEARPPFAEAAPFGPGKRSFFED